VTVDCQGSVGSVLVSGTNGIVITAAATDIVVVRNLHIPGINAGLASIRINSAAVVSIEDCIITEFTQQGISIPEPPVTAGSSGTRWSV